ncbi:hypothetical protein BLNAU_22049 [Blattamonas nauphoetae]|uniref:Uncharacterized protein n=1 Tax=Blattamonas nauphoetae TaxID=2049346 RepID=A0ABQ9WUN8_9EUKA|nr:hypothetical protein BLNAU_22049 [Blattamonas nauphoetae]
MKVKVFRRNNVPSSELTEDHARSHLIRSPGWNPTNISSLLEVLHCDDEDIIDDTLRTLQKVASESLFFECAIVDSLFHQHKDFIFSAFDKIEGSSPPPANITALARISLFPHLRIADCSLEALNEVVKRDPTTFTLLPSPIFPSSSPFEQFSGLSFLAALTKKLRIVFSEFQRNLPTDPSHIPKFIQLTNDVPSIFACSLVFCSNAFLLPTHLMTAEPPIEVDSEIVLELLVLVKEALPMILWTIPFIDNLIHSLPSNSSSTTQMVFEDEMQMVDSLDDLKDGCEEFMSSGWNYLLNLTFILSDPLKSSFQTIILDDPSFTSLILNSLQLSHAYIKLDVIATIQNITVDYPWMKEKFMTSNFVGMMFETVDFVSLPLSESETLFYLTKFLANMFLPIGDDEQARFEQYPRIHVSVFEPAKQFIIFMFRQSDKLILNEEFKAQLEDRLSWIHRHINNMELRSDEHDADFVSELVKWEVRQMVEMENEVNFERVFRRSIWNRAREWRRGKQERKKRREVRLREEGWDDALELRVVGIEVDTNQSLADHAALFRIDQGFNTVGA